jgi:hypothetical protein
VCGSGYKYASWLKDNLSAYHGDNLINEKKESSGGNEIFSKIPDPQQVKTSHCLVEQVTFI